MRATIWAALAAIAIVTGAAGAEGDMGQKPSDYLASGVIKVEHSGSIWTISGASRTVAFDESDFSMSVKAGRTTWPLLGSDGSDLVIADGSERFGAKLTDAGKIDVSPYQTGCRSGIRIGLREFRHGDKTLDATLQLFVTMEEPGEELICEAVPTEGSAAFKEIRWPKPFEPEAVDQAVVPAMQGMLLPRDWPKKVWLYDNMNYGRVYMPWYGARIGDSAAIVIMETPEDGGFVFDHPEGGPTLLGLRWVHSLGEMRYPRRARMAFFEQGDYVTLAKRYRRYVMETGHFVSLREKIARSSIVERLIGAPVIHTSILYHTQPESIYYKKDDPAANHALVTFDQRAEELKALAARGAKRAYVHLDGWGFRGYDNLHPDVLPPCPEAGGWDGMKRLADACDEIGYVFALHDQYRDYYVDAASYDDRHTILDENGNRPFVAVWAGGKQSVLCSRLAPEYVSRNHRALHEHGVKVRGSYLDVFAVVPPDECYNPEHPVTRAQCLQYRGDCLDLVRSLDGVVSSEEPADWAIPHVDLVHHAPYALDPDPGAGPAMGIAVPLFDLVYHDALIVPWTASATKGGWGIPNTDAGYLHCLLNGGIPYMSISPLDEEIGRTRIACALHRRVGLLEMTKHEFLDDSRRRQRTTFADGTTVTVDFDAGAYEIVPDLTRAELGRVELGSD